MPRKSEPDSASPTVGFIIEDTKDAPFVETSRVNLYSYVSAAVLTIQEQDREIRELRARLDRLEKK